MRSPHTNPNLGPDPKANKRVPVEWGSTRCPRSMEVAEYKQLERGTVGVGPSLNSPLDRRLKNKA